VATFTRLASGNWRVQVRRKTRYVAETFRRRKDGEEWALEMERNIDRNGSSKPRVVRNIRTFGDLIDLHDEDMREVGKPPRRSKAAVIASLKTELGSVKLPAPNRERQANEILRKARAQGRTPRRHNLNQMASGKPGAVQFVVLVSAAHGSGGWISGFGAFIATSDTSLSRRSNLSPATDT
jgi:hypothetical protein